MPLLKTKGIPASDLLNCEGWVNGRGSESYLLNRAREQAAVYANCENALRVLQNDDDWEDLPSHNVARIEVRQRGRFLTLRVHSGCR